MGAFLKQAATLLAGKMAGSNNKATFVVKTARTIYTTEAVLIAVVWYSAWRNERVAPGKVSFPIPGMRNLKRQFPPDRPEQELDRPKPAGGGAAHPGTGSAMLPGGQQAQSMSLNGPLSLNKGIAKANELSGKYPYVWGGGHAQVGIPTGGGYDCSGAVSAVLGAIGLLTRPLVSGELAAWGEPGPGNFITVYANAEHTFMRLNINGTWRWFGTGSGKKAVRGGPAWGNHDSELGAYSVRHPRGY